MQHWIHGQVLHSGKYVIKDTLGGGGYGVTYRAENRKEGKLVAIKSLNATIQGRRDFNQLQVKFVNEAVSLAKCSHPHVVQVYEVFQEGHLWCMAMEYIDGISLADYLEDRRVLSEPEALPIIQQVGEALSFVHKQGLTHRDVKPLNIMLRKGSLKAVLIDFGLAREATVPGKLRSNTSAGTECFMPIEQYERRTERGAYTDVYALAADYRKLRDLLAAGKWREADEETGKVMLKVAGREKEGGLDTESIDKFPCEDLRTIDQLWVKYSNGRFGFSVQKRIYQSLGGTRKCGDDKFWDAYGDRIGWRKNGEWLYDGQLTFSTKAPEAHLPCGVGVWWLEDFGFRFMGTEMSWVYIFSRVETCRL